MMPKYLWVLLLIYGMSNSLILMKKYTVFVLLIVVALVSVNAQEVMTGLAQHPGVVQFLNENRYAEKSDKNIAVRMPFIDDFSSYYGYPKQSHWADSSVFVGDGYSRNNITFGCATFDAFDSNGEIYAIGSTFPFKADFLTSKSIRLDSVFTGTPHIATPADSIYLSFFYQPQGWGDKPETEDSLVLQLYNPVADTWNTVWSSPGMGFQQFKDLYGVDFKSVMIPIVDADYFSPDFKFRFYNIASLANNSFPTWAGNVDFWNIDYVYLNAGRNLNDTFPVDAAFRSRLPSLLKEYHSMPWSHFQVSPAANMISGVAVPYKNYSSVLLNLTEVLIIEDLKGTGPGYNSGISASNLNPLVDTVFFRNPFPYVFSTDITENAEFLARFIINSATIPDFVRSNDTLQLYQRFYNYFSYDDGTPEAGYGLVGAGAQLAYKFILGHPDTLRSVQMQFNRVYNNVNEDFYFNLRVWNDIGGKPGDLIYDQFGMRPIVDGFYGFHTYELEEPLPVTGTIYVGWRQQDADALNIGFDRNTNRNSKIFFNVDGNWYNSMFEGALMMRIITGDSPEAYVDIKEEQPSNVRIWPNPVVAGEGFTIEADLPFGSIVHIFSADGKMLWTGEYNDSQIKLSIPSGIYNISLTDVHSGKRISTRILVIE
jgi:hypothetical protein